MERRPVAWTKSDLRKLDIKYAEEGVHLHQRPLRAAMDLLGPAFSFGIGTNPKVKEITDAYAALVPEVNTTWPGAGIGVAVSVDQVRKVTLPVLFGEQVLEPWKATGFKSRDEWWDWCRGDFDIASEASFAFADIYDFSCGLNEVRKANPAAIKLWSMAQSNLEDLANTLPSAFSVNSVLQPVFMVAELALKGSLVWSGVSADSFKGKSGHDLVSLAKRLAREMSHRDDPRIELIVKEMPEYVESRYNPAGLTRLRVARLALSVQFIAASALRRVASIDLASKMEIGGWPAPRRPLP